MSGRQNAAGHHRPYDSSATAVDRAAELTQQHSHRHTVERTFSVTLSAGRPRIGGRLGSKEAARPRITNLHRNQ
jgi:hypothetical protein